MKSEKVVAMGIVFASAVVMLVIFVGTASAALPIGSVMGTVEQKIDTKLEIHTEWKSGDFGGQGWNHFESTLELPFEFFDSEIVDVVWDEISVGDYVEVSGFHCMGEEQVCLANCLCIAKVKSSGDGLADKIITDIYGDPALLSWRWGDEPFKYDPPLLGNFNIEYDNKPDCPDCPPGCICEAEYTNIKISKDGNVLDTFSLYPNQNYVYEGEEHRIDVTFFSGATQCCLGGQVPSNFVIHIEENSPPKIVSAFWSLWFKIDDEWKRKDSAVDQEKRTLVAIIENAEGKEVTFNIHECDLPWCHSKTPITTVKASVKNGEATATWIVEWMDDGPLEGDPEYKFEVIVDGVSADSENELRVSLHSTSEWEDMPVGDCQGSDEDGVIKIISAPDKAVKKGQEFEVVIEVSPRMKSGNTYLMFLTNDNIEKTNLFMDKKGIKINQEESKISIDYIEYKDSDVPYALFILLTTFGKLSYPPAFDVADAFSLLGFVTGTSPTPPDMAIELGRSYLLGQRDKIESDIKYIFDKFKLKEAYPLMSMGGQGKNVMNYKLKLKAPYDDGPYKLSLSAKYSILCYKFKPDQEKKMYCLVSTIGAAAGGRLKAEASKAYRGYFKEYTACDSVTIGIGNCKVFTTKCPVDMSIMDPEGLTINKQINEISGAVYTEQDINGDGDPDDWIIIPNPRIGDYEITVIPEPDAKSTDTYTLEVSSVDTTIAIAKNVPISEIPTEPYIFKSDQNQPPHNPTLTPDKSKPHPLGTVIPVNITNNEVDDSDPTIVQISNGDILVAYTNWLNGAQIYLTRSSDNGLMWSTPVAITNQYHNIDPYITHTSDGKVWIVWAGSWVPGDFDNYYVTSDDNGQTWSEIKHIPTPEDWSTHTTIAEDSNHNVWIMWGDHYVISDDFGEHWSQINQIPSWNGNNPSLFCDANGRLWIVTWSGGDIRYKISDDNGQTWSSYTVVVDELSQDEAIVIPEITQFLDGTIWITYHSNINGNREVYYTSSSDNGNTWSNPKQITNNSSQDWMPAIASITRGIGITWDSNRDGDRDIYLTRFFIIC